MFLHFVLTLTITFALIGTLIFIATYQEPGRPSEDNLIRFLAVALVALAGFNLIAHYNNIVPGTDASRPDIIAMIKECEADLPRSQKCVIDIGVRPE